MKRNALCQFRTTPAVRRILMRRAAGENRSLSQMLAHRVEKWIEEETRVEKWIEESKESK